MVLAACSLVIMEALDVVTKPEWASGLHLSAYGRYYKSVVDDYEE